MSNPDKRQSDVAPLASYPRTEQRVFCRDGEWFFSSREGDMGPFATEAEADEQMQAYVMLIDLKEENESPVTPDIT